VTGGAEFGAPCVVSDPPLIADAALLQSGYTATVVPLRRRNTERAGNSVKSH